ncbi:hypothetical protein PG996_013793 [Apiospora saccharicola]|uniref:Uncharacterized protein n=1 Tax=Apiospora saccharicola TaxID=335842 RepID=A0ABR1TGH5_9PEZI
MSKRHHTRPLTCKSYKEYQERNHPSLLRQQRRHKRALYDASDLSFSALSFSHRQAINNTAAGNAPSGNNHSHGTASSSSSNNNNNNNYYHYNNSCIASPTNTASSSSATVFDYNDPCATGGCLFSQGCGSGQCRLEQLGGRWVCCRCRRGGNTFRWCAHPMRRVPDTLCYHQVCLGCRADQGDSGQGQSS